MKNINLEKVFRTNLRNGERIDDTRFLYSEKHFDEKGNLILTRIFSEGNMLVEKNVFKYNEQNQRIEHEYFVDENEWSEKNISEYDENNRLIKETITYMDGSESVSTFEYENDKIVSVITRDMDEDEVTESIQRKFDENGLLLKEEKFEYGELVSSEENVWNSDGKLVQRKTYNADNDGFTLEAFNIENGLLESFSKTYPDGRIEKFKNTYDEKDNVIRIDFEGTYRSNTQILYDENNEIIYEKEILEDETILYEIKRKFIDKRLIEALHFLNRMGQGINVEYALDYEYDDRE